MTLNERTESKPFRAWRAFLQSYNKLMRKLEQEMQTEHNLTPSWYDVLIQLDNAPHKGLQMHDLANAVILSPSGLTRLLDRMSEAGLVVRRTCETDRRVCYAVITPKGEQLLEDILPAQIDRVDKYFMQHLTEEEAEVLLRVFERVLTVVEN